MQARSASQAAAGSIAELSERVRAGKAARLAHFGASRATTAAASRLVRALARHADAALTALWQRFELPPGASLVAVGGYGRGELYPSSDVDVLVLLPGGDPLHEPRWRAGIEAFIAGCWDLGLEIGSAVRSIDECLAESARDLTVQTALLESRRVCGARRSFEDFRRARDAATDAAAFLRAKTAEMRQRHLKYEGTPYALEPNCKESPGGLRDLQILIWIARAAGLGRSWKELAARGLATPFELQQLEHNEGILRLIRARLHLVAGRREDRLVFDLQAAVAESFGLKRQRGQRNSEALMHRYYWAAKAVTQLNQILLLGIEERILGSERQPMRPIDADFLDRGGLLEVARDSLYQEDPRAILRTFLVFAQEDSIHGLSARTLRALYNARDLMDTRFRHDPVNRATFMAILRQPQGITHAFRLLNQTSVLGRYLWVFRRIVGRMQNDLFHVYTVDQHILMVLRNMRRFFIPEHAHEYPLCSQLAAEFDRPWTLYLAALFHDVAKGRGGDHSELGARDLRRFCREHGIGGDDAVLAEFLVREHLTMSRVAQKEDLSDPEVVARFAHLVGSVRRLDALYLLTVADIRGTSPKVWNAWKAKLLQDLYHTTLRALGGAQPNLLADIEARKAEARQRLALASALPGTEGPLWATLDTRYFLRHDPGDIAWHARALWRHVDTASPIVSARPSPIGEGLQVMVYAPDRADLFARICGYFDGAGFSILDARIHTTARGHALDTFQVVRAFGDDHGPAAYRDLIALVEHRLRQALVDEGPLPEPTRGRVSRRVRSFPVTPRIELAPDERGQRWLLTVSTSDRSGLLYGIARVLARHRINLHLAKITTLGERVEDTFLVDGAALGDSRQQLRIEAELLDAIGPQR